MIDDCMIGTVATTPHNTTGLQTVHLVVPVHVAFGRHLSTEYGVESLVLTTGQHLQFDRNFQGSPFRQLVNFEIMEQSSALRTSVFGPMHLSASKSK